MTCTTSWLIAADVDAYQNTSNQSPTCLIIPFCNQVDKMGLCWPFDTEIYKKKTLWIIMRCHNHTHVYIYNIFLRYVTAKCVYSSHHSISVKDDQYVGILPITSPGFFGAHFKVNSRPNSKEGPGTTITWRRIIRERPATWPFGRLDFQGYV